jgi:hypothetical protein
MKINFQKDLSYKIQISILQKMKNFKKNDDYEDDYSLQNLLKIMNSLHRVGLNWNEMKEIEKNDTKNEKNENESMYDIADYSIEAVFLHAIDNFVHTLTSKQISNLFLIFNKMNLKFDIMSHKIQRNGTFFLLPLFLSLPQLWLLLLLLDIRFSAFIYI